MARSKEFDEERALAAAVEVFWRQGYENTSLEALMREMGIAKQSLYDTFGDKRALYLKALRQYRNNDHARLRRLFASGQPVKDGFAELLLGISSESRVEHERGCLAKDIQELVHQLGFSEVSIVGHDIGLMVAYAYAAQ